MSSFYRPTCVHSFCTKANIFNDTDTPWALSTVCRIKNLFMSSFTVRRFPFVFSRVNSHLIIQLAVGVSVSLRVLVATWLLHCVCRGVWVPQWFAILSFNLCVVRIWELTVSSLLWFHLLHRMVGLINIIGWEQKCGNKIWMYELESDEDVPV